LASAEIQEVRKFGRDERVTELTQSKLPDHENLGWEMTAIAADVIGAQGAYRCPNERGRLPLRRADVGSASRDEKQGELTKTRVKAPAFRAAVGVKSAIRSYKKL
jgi:hypothetical protein